MNKRYFIFLFIPLIFSCASIKYVPGKRYPANILKEDFNYLRNTLQAKHPSLYWYTSKDSMDYYFNEYYNSITDSMTEREFAWKILSPAIQKIHCGHTSVSMSKGYVRFMDGRKLPSFPMFLKIWNDTAAVTGALRKDSVLTRGTIIKSINGLSVDSMVRKMFDYLPEDGYEESNNFIRISSGFPYFHRNIFGLSHNYRVSFIAKDGSVSDTIIPVYEPPQPQKSRDTTIKVAKVVKVPKVKKQAPKKTYYRSLNIDSTGNFAVMEVNSFTYGNMRNFFRRSFKTLRKKKVDYLILDILSNNGGKVGLSTMLTKYISRTPFKVADTAYANSNTLKPFTKSFKGKWLNNFQLFFSTHKKSDGKYHLRFYERHHYKLKKRNHYSGKVYVLIAGPTFSAASVFSNAVKGQKDVVLVGEETGGGWHGNSGIMIPALTLPHTRTRINIPLFRLVQYNHVSKTGTGVMPDIYIGTSYDALLLNVDRKMEVVKEFIKEDIKNKE